MQIIPRPEHPNPQWERKNWKNLNGQWQFEIDNGKSGEVRGLPTAESLSGTITLPFCPESELSGIGNKEFMYAVWYKKNLSFAEEDLCGSRVLFHIGACDFETHVWVNGKKAGLPHIGGSGPIEYDITDLLKTGDNDVTICAYDDTRAGNQAGGKQSTTYNSRGCYYTRTTGIWQTVWYEIVPESYIKSAKFYPDAENAVLSINAELAGCGDFSAEVYYEGKKVGEACKKNKSVTGQLEVVLSEKHLWEPGCGRLYDVVLKFGKDEVKSYFGLRSIELKDMKFLLNGKSVFQRTVLDQGFYADGIWTAPTEEALIRDIELSMAAGFNGARLHQKVFEPRFLYHADRLGYMVWGEYSSWGLDVTTKEAVAWFMPDWLSTVHRDFNHPAIIGWCPFNETWTYGTKRSWQDDAVIRIAYEETKRTDPTRPCIDTSGGIHVATDIMDTHWYEQDGQLMRETYEKISSENYLRLQFADRDLPWDGKQPIFVSEYGGIGIHLPEKDGDRVGAWSYGNSATSYEEFYARYESLTHAILDNPKIMGFCYTQLTDVEQEQNGLFEYATRKPKFDLEIISRINKKKAAIED